MADEPAAPEPVAPESAGPAFASLLGISLMMLLTSWNRAKHRLGDASGLIVSTLAEHKLSIAPILRNGSDTSVRVPCVVPTLLSAIETGSTPHGSMQLG